PARNDANRIGTGFTAGSYLIRMVADSDRSLSWLRWASPFGWIEELRPLTGSKPFAFVPIVVAIAVLVTVSMRMARARDLGASALPSRDSRAPRTLLLGGQAGLTVRLTRGAVLTWIGSMGATGLACGCVTHAAG